VNSFFKKKPTPRQGLRNYFKEEPFGGGDYLNNFQKFRSTGEGILNKPSFGRIGQKFVAITTSIRHSQVWRLYGLGGPSELIIRSPKRGPPHSQFL